MLPRLPRLRSRALLAVLVAATALLGAGLAAPSHVAGLGPLPACRYDDILTDPRGYDDWAITLVDTILRVPATYAPPDLVPVSDAGIAGSGKIRAVAIADLEALSDAAKAAGNGVAVQSAYRSYAKQQATFRYWVNLLGRKRALLVSARPGHSEHQLGLAIDFKTAGGGSPFEGDWGQSPAGSWMRKHAWEYGWLLSYPEGQRAVTCYAYESWHFRYVGRNLAAAIHDSGLTTRQYLWTHYTTARVPHSAATPTPAPTARPTASPSPTPSPIPSAAGSPSPGSTASPAPASPSPSAGPTTAPSASVAPSSSPPGPAATGTDAAAVAAVIGVGLGIAALAGLLALRRRRPGPPAAPPA